jgi:hypothetical protein
LQDAAGVNLRVPGKNDVSRTRNNLSSGLRHSFTVLSGITWPRKACLTRCRKLGPAAHPRADAFNNESGGSTCRLVLVIWGIGTLILRGKRVAHQARTRAQREH